MTLFCSFQSEMLRLREFISKMVWYLMLTRYRSCVSALGESRTIVFGWRGLAGGLGELG